MNAVDKHTKSHYENNDENVFWQHKHIHSTRHEQATSIHSETVFAMIN